MAGFLLEFYRQFFLHQMHVKAVLDREEYNLLRLQHYSWERFQWLSIDFVARSAMVLLQYPTGSTHSIGEHVRYRLLQQQLHCLYRLF